MCPVNAWGSKTDTHYTHSAVSSLEKLSHRCVFLMCDVFGAVDAAAYEQEESGDDHVWMHHPTNSATDTFSVLASSTCVMPRAVRICFNFMANVVGGIIIYSLYQIRPR